MQKSPLEGTSTRGTDASTVGSMSQLYPLLYAVGDSISIGWLPHVAHCIGKASERLISARYTVAHAPQWGTSEVLRARIAEWLRGHHPAVIACNSGLHDIGRTPATDWQQAVAPERYEQNLEALIGIVGTAAPSTRLLWLTTTPIIRSRMDDTDSYHLYHRHQSDIDEYNRIGAEVMKRNSVEMLDLHRAVERAGRSQLIGPDGVHFTDEGYRLLGNLIAWRIIGEDLRPAGEEKG